MLRPRLRLRLRLRPRPRRSTEPSVLAIWSFIVGVKLFMEPALQPSAALSRGAFNRVRSRTRQLTFSPRSIAWSTTSQPVRPDAPNTAMVLTTSVDRRARWARASGCVTRGPWTNVVAVRAVARGKESASAMSSEDASRGCVPRAAAPRRRKCPKLPKGPGYLHNDVVQRRT